MKKGVSDEVDFLTLCIYIYILLLLYINEVHVL